MNTRPSTLPTPTSRRYWHARGDLWFRTPPFGVGLPLLSFIGQHSHPDDSLDGPAKLAALLPPMGLAAGACWHHLGVELNPLPESQDNWLEHGEYVIDALQELGYDLPDVLALCTVACDGLRERMSLIEKAEKKADFSVAPEANSTHS